MDLKSGPVVIELRPDLAPKHVERIKTLSERSFYDGVPFHRVIPNFMAQTGDPTGTGSGGSDLPDLKAEFSNEKHVRGTVSMARTANPNSANSQFFICFADAPLARPPVHGVGPGYLRHGACGRDQKGRRAQQWRHLRGARQNPEDARGARLSARLSDPAFTEYERDTILSRNPLARLSHRARISQALALITRYLPPRGALLDFGCAQGELLTQLRAICPEARLYGLDPLLAGKGYTHFRSPAECEGLLFEVIAAFEVLEHLDDSSTDTFFCLLENHLSPDGVCIVSVPNMLGPVLLPKLLHAALFSGSALGYGAGEAASAALLLKSPRRLAPDRRGTMRHKGYDWRHTRARIAAEFAIISEMVTPLPALWWGFNSQWFCVFRPHGCSPNT